MLLPGRGVGAPGVGDFVYQLDKHGRQKGWGVAEYSTPEKRFGQEFRQQVYQRSPEESRERILEHLSELFPLVSTETLRKLLK